MNEIVKGNFLKFLPDILKAIEDANFFAIDTEFTGLVFDAANKTTLSDDGATRYGKYRESVSNFTLLEIGLACFTEVDQPLGRSPLYRVKNFNFVVYPHDFGPADTRFACQASSLRFNVEHNVDLNRIVKDGIGYLNSAQLGNFKKMLEQKSWCEHANAYNLDGTIKRVCSYVTEWWCDEDDDLEEIRRRTFQRAPRQPFANAANKAPVANSSRVQETSKPAERGVPLPSANENAANAENADADSNTLELDAETLAQLDATECPLYILKHELRVRLAEALNVHIRIDLNKRSIVIEWLGKQVRQQSPSDLKSELDRDQVEMHAYLQDLRGFSAIFDALIRTKKPLVGHNCMLDLLFFFEKLYSPLPSEYSEFKRILHGQLFPTVFDTKHIAFYIRKLLEDRYNDADGAPGKLYADVRSVNSNSQQSVTSTNSVQRQRMYQYTSVLGGSLGQLFRSLSKHYAANMPACFVSLVLPQDSASSDSSEVAVESEIGKHAHRAAVDALMTGVVFLKMAHIAALEHVAAQLSKSSLSDQEVTKLLDEQSFSFKQYLNALDSLDCTNRINCIYGAVRHFRLNADDPPAFPPTLLLAETASPAGTRLDVLDVTRRLMPFGAFEVALRDPRSARIAVGSAYVSRKLLELYGSPSQSGASFRLLPYAVLRRERISRAPIWFCVVLGFAGASALVSYSLLKKSR